MTHIATGQCSCGEVRYALKENPLFVHCCHCTWCQRETGSAFVLNGIIERSAVTLLDGKPEEILTPSDSGAGQRIFRCPTCHVALWSVYSGAGPKFLFLRMGTLNERDQFQPDVHIFTSTKLPWVVIPEGARAYKGYYNRDRIWPKASLRRREAALAAD